MAKRIDLKRPSKARRVEGDLYECTKCRGMLPRGEFHLSNNPENPHGIDYCCTPCKRKIKFEKAEILRLEKEEQERQTKVPATKVCTYCENELPASHFNKNSSSKDGLGSRCKECVKMVRKENELIKLRERGY